MSRVWKNLKTNWMYWRFRYITRTRLRLRAWWNHRRASFAGVRSRVLQIQRPGDTYRPRASAAFVSRRSSRRVWGLLLGMVLALTALSAWANSTYVAPAVVYGIGSLVIVAAAYAALRGL
jgi:hypothetical protein